jgi:hypothetical protein
MKFSRFNKRRAVSISVFALGFVSLTLVFYYRAFPQSQATGFTLYSTMTTKSKDGTPVTTGTRVRYQAADGTFKQITTYLGPDGSVVKTDILFGKPNRGVFSVDSKTQTIEFVSSLSPKSILLSEQDLRQTHHNILREETMLGHRVLVSRLGDDEKYTELYHAVDLMGFQIKTVEVGPNATLTIEPTKVVVGNPSQEELRNLPRYPISFSLYEQKIKTIEERGDSETAQQMREILRVAKSTSPP